MKNWKIKEIGNNKQKKFHKTHAFCNDNLKEDKTKSEEEKAIDKVVARVMKENEKPKERQKPEEDKEKSLARKEILEEESVLSKIIVKNWQAIKGRGHCEKIVILKRKKLFNHKDVTIRANEERIRIILDGIDINIIPTSELLEEYAVSSLKVLAEEGTSRPKNKERLRKIFEKAGIIIVNPPEHEQHVVTSALGYLPKKKIVIQTNGERLKKALEEIQNIKKFWSNSKKVPLFLTNALIEQEKESMTIHIIGDRPEKLPNRVRVDVENIEGLERSMYLLIDLNKKERKILDKWIFENYSE